MKKAKVENFKKKCAVRKISLWWKMILYKRIFDKFKHPAATLIQKFLRGYQVFQEYQFVIKKHKIMGETSEKLKNALRKYELMELKKQRKKYAVEKFN